MDCAAPEQNIEQATRRIGRTIFAQARQGANGAGFIEWWDRRLMDVTMRDPLARSALFRFVDVLPALNAPRTIAKYLRQYVEPVHDRFGPLISKAIAYLPEDGWVGDRVAELAHW